MGVSVVAAVVVDDDDEDVDALLFSLVISSKSDFSSKGVLVSMLVESFFFVKKIEK
jgi:hypothetical protein